MSILVDKSTRLVVQGMTGNEGKFHTAQMIDYGTQVVAGVTPGRGGQTCLDRPVYDTMQEAVRETQPNACCVFVPARFAADAALEAIDAEIPLVIVITEGIPTLQMMKVYWEAQRRGVRVIGPNCPGVITPGEAKIGIMPGHIHMPGKVGVVSRSGTLTYEFVNELTRENFGQTTCIGIGGDPIVGTDFVDSLRLFNEDPATEAVVMIGEIGGAAEERAAEYVKREMVKPVVGFIAGRTAPPGKRMGHAGAIIAGGSGTAAEKISALEAAGIAVCERPGQVGEKLRQAGVRPLS
ncbi:MAG: Succinyl-CoA ligase (ADP-forming) subunit alpha [candidate division BRC1 bacterium ADurb.BinA292]|nr:MAG: Succinyl-CoA ligase (ADP-forming) subunit alpha [candidate division BRC1 bacterium ADurb.BinA292]HOR28336.1 succinate--CoA ligase subunit alpha [Candidatus Sumerlaeota bacterium]